MAGADGAELDTVELADLASAALAHPERVAPLRTWLASVGVPLDAEIAATTRQG